MGSTRRTCRFMSRRDVSSQVEFGLKALSPFGERFITQQQHAHIIYSPTHYLEYSILELSHFHKYFVQIHSTIKCNAGEVYLGGGLRSACIGLPALHCPDVQHTELRSDRMQ